ncbi:hypothetical protein O7614_04510 [Micromonospora sp. WMMD961]|nr:hypothetical protein [Micromonospora sp. WMMD961]MDG4778909.1 hypothetical protein [Micromonospora sp. WMMD961]
MSVDRGPGRVADGGPTPLGVEVAAGAVVVTGVALVAAVFGGPDGR